MKKLIILLFFALPTLAFGWNSSPEDFCSKISSNFREIVNQFPLQIDRLTLLIGAVAVFADDTCYITYNYLINQDLFIETAQAGAKVAGEEVPNKSTVIRDMGTEQGRELFRSNIVASANEYLYEMAGLEFTFTTLHYVFDQGDIKPITIKVEEYIAR